jgi:N-methylhydantoinase A
MSAAAARERFDAIRKQVLADMASERIDRSEISFELSADMRYAGQAFEINIAVPQTALQDEAGIADLVADFNDEHKRLYGYLVAGEPVEFVNFRVTALGRVQKAELAMREASASALPPSVGRRLVYFGGVAAEEVPVWRRVDLSAGHSIDGPAIIEDSGASIPLMRGHRMTVDGIGNLRISINTDEEARREHH